jgi:hypothetical protein
LPRHGERDPRETRAYDTQALKQVTTECIHAIFCQIYL